MQRLNETEVHNPKTGGVDNLVFKDEIISSETYFLNDGSTVCENVGKALAKRSKMTDGSLFYIKFGTDGMYDPLGLYSTGTQNIECQRFGKPIWGYKKVKKNVFDLYIKYLLTKNRTYYLQATREHRNG